MELLGKAAQEQTTDLTEGQRGQLADAVMDRMVSADPKNFEVYIARFGFRDRYELPRAEEDLASAIKYAPENVNVILLAARYAYRQAEQSRQARKPASEPDRLFKDSQKYYEQAVKLAPADERGYAGLGDVLAAQNNPDEAVKTWRRPGEVQGQRRTEFADCRGAHCEGGVCGRGRAHPTA